MTTKVELDPKPCPIVTRWPTTMPRLTKHHFLHGEWSNVEIYQWDADKGYQPDEEQLPKLTRCGTPRCAVGNVIAAFGRDCRVTAWRFSPLVQQVTAGEGPVAKFVDHYMAELGHDPDVKGVCKFTELSDVFESNSRVSAQTAADAWNRTIEHFGYTEEK